MDPFVSGPATHDQYGDPLPADLYGIPFLDPRLLRQSELKELMNADWYEDNFGNLYISLKAISPGYVREELVDPEDMLAPEDLEQRTFSKVQPILHRYEVPDWDDRLHFYHA